MISLLAATALNLAQQYAQTLPVVTICADVQSETLRQQFGSAVVVRNGKVLTAAHVTRCADPTHVRLAVLVDGVEATLTREDTDADLALLDVATARGRTVLLAPAPTLGARLCHTNAVPIISRACGEVVPAQNYELAPNAIVSTAPTFGGNSGGPAWDTRGRLIGVTSKAIRCAASETCGGVTAQVTAEFLK